MATLDLAQIQTDLRVLAATLHQTVVGLEDLLAAHLTDPERAQIQGLLDTYQQWVVATADLRAAVQVLQDYGYPVLPTLTVAQELVTKLQAELEAEVAALAQLLAQELAVAGTLGFAPPIEKH
jgi:hypothetical protein